MISATIKELNGELSRAVENGDGALASRLLAQGASANAECATEGNGRERPETVLQCALANDDLDMVKVLLNHGAEPELCRHPFNMPALIALRRGLSNASDRMEERERACLECLDALLQAGADPNAPAALYKGRDFEDRRTLLHECASRGMLEWVRVLLQRGPAVNLADAAGVKPLDEAIAVGGRALVEALMEAGASPYSRTAVGEDWWWRKDKHGENALERAAARPDGGVVLGALLGHCRGPVDVVAPDTGDTALTVACRKGNTEAVKLLLDRGADPDRVSRGYGDDQRHNPLCVAAGNGHYGCVQLLLDAGADTDTGKAFVVSYIAAIMNKHWDCAALVLGATEDDKVLDVLVNLYRKNDPTVGSYRPFSEKDETPVQYNLDDWRRNQWGRIKADVRRILLGRVLDAGCCGDPSRADFAGNTLLHHLCRASAPSADLRMLLEKRDVDVNATDQAGATPLMLYLGSDNPWPSKAGVDVLLGYGAELNMRDKAGKGALDYLRDKAGGKGGVRDHLLNLGAEEPQAKDERSNAAGTMNVDDGVTGHALRP